MTDKIIGLRLTDAEIRKLHATPAGWTSQFTTSCQCPVCRPPEPEKEEGT